MKIINEIGVEVNIRKDLRNKIFGDLKAIIPSSKKYYWKCECKCGGSRNVLSSRLMDNSVFDCLKCSRIRLGKKNSKHGKRYTRIYDTWRNMKARCSSKKHHAYKYYGGKGIKVCEEWKIFNGFDSWALANGYNETLTLDRIDVSKGYNADNCRWVNHITQMNNTTRNKYITIKNVTKTLSEWCEITGLNYGTVKNRINNLKWTNEESLEFVYKKRWCSK